MKKVLEKSSLPGIPRILENDHLIIKLIWSLGVVCLTSLSIYYSIINIIVFFQYPTFTSINIINEKLLLFPTVSFCFRTKNAQFRPENLIKDCRFNLNNCTYQDFELALVNISSIDYYKTCLRFNSGKNYLNESIELKKISKTSLNSGLYLTFYLEDFIIFDESLPSIFKMQIYIHNNTKYFNFFPIYDIDFGLLVTSGVNQIQVEREFIQNLPEPYSDCIKQDTLKNNVSHLFDYLINQNKSYSKKDCYDLCIREFIMNKCDCFIDLNSVENCFVNNMNTSNCVYGIYQQFLYEKIEIPNECIEYCPNECDSINYKIKLNSFIIDDQFLNINNYSSSISNNIVNLALYYPNKQYTLISETPIMQVFDLVSNIGGIISLFIGFSFLTLVEFIDVILKICFYFFDNKVHLV
jgi:hypothetical protein